MAVQLAAAEIGVRCKYYCGAGTVVEAAAESKLANVVGSQADRIGKIQPQVISKCRICQSSRRLALPISIQQRCCRSIDG